METKAEIRKEIKQKLNQQTQVQRLRKSSLIKEKLFKLAEFKRAKQVMFYIATEEEVQTRAMIAQAAKLGKKIVVPVILREEKRMIASSVGDLERELCLGPYGIMQPKSEYIREVPGSKVDLTVVPGLAFDQQGRRLGRGRGYFDRFLAGLSRHTPRIGLAFDFQVLEGLPSFPHDIPMTCVISA